MGQQSEFFTRAALGFVRVATISPELRVADVGFNTQKTIEAMAVAAAQGVQFVGGSADDLGAFMRTEAKRWGEVIESTGMKAQ